MSRSICGISAEARTRVLIVYLLVVVVLLSVMNHDRAYDDPFITYRYAENLSSGIGFVYNPGQRVLSTTTPLYTLLLALLSFLWTDLPLLSNLISVFSLAIGAFFIYRLGQNWDEPLAGLVGAILYPLSPLMISTLGAETCFYVMLTLGAFAFHSEERYGVAMFLAGLATLTRADGILVASVLGLGYILKYRRVPWIPALVFGLTIMPWYLFSWLYFGSPFPVTLAAKQQQGQMAISQYFASGLWALIVSRLRNWRIWLSSIVLLVGWVYAFVKARRWLLLLGWSVVYFLGYTFLGVSRYFWYYAPFVPVPLAGIGLGVSWIQRYVSLRLPTMRSRCVLVGLVILLVFVPQARNAIRQSRYRDPRAVIYRDVGVWLNEKTSEDASVGTLEIGIIGYYAKRAVVDFAGLIQPEVAQQMTLETTYADTAYWAITEYVPDYLVMNPNAFPEYLMDFVRGHCLELHTFEEPSYQGQLIAYGCSYAE